MAARCVDQEKAAAYRTTDSSPSLSKPTHLKPKEVYFVLRVRAAQLRRRAYLKKIQVPEVSRCRHFTTDSETLAHSLGHCPHKIGSRVHTRQNRALERNTKYIKSSENNRGRTFSIGSFPEEVQTLLRPEIILIAKIRMTMVIADGAILFEDYKTNSMGAASIRDEEKYQSLKTLWKTGASGGSAGFSLWISRLYCTRK